MTGSGRNEIAKRLDDILSESEKTTAVVKSLIEELGRPEAPTEPLIFVADQPTTEPVTSPEGAWLGLRTLLMVARFDHEADGYENLAGGDSTQDNRGGMGIGRRQDGQLEGWLIAGGEFVTPAVHITPRKASMVAWRIIDDDGPKLMLSCDEDAAIADIIGPVVPFDGPAVLGATWWRDELVDPLDGTILAAAGYRTSLTDDEVDAWQKMHADLIDDEPVPPEGPDLQRGLLWERGAVTEVEDFPSGAWLALRTLAMVVKVGKAGKREKLAGADSSANEVGAWCVERRPDGGCASWVYSGGIRNCLVPIPENRAVMAAIRLQDKTSSLMVDHAGSVAGLPEGMSVADGPAVLRAGYWQHAKIDPALPTTEMRSVRAYDRPLSDAELAMLAESWSELIEDEAVITPPPPVPEKPPAEKPPPAGDLEPVNQAALQIAILVAKEPRQTFIGYGWGAHLPTIALHERHAAQLFDEMGTRALRIHNPLEPTFVRDNLDLVRLAVSRGVKEILATGYMARYPGVTPAAFADRVADAIHAGIPITIVSPQNEPDGNAKNAVTDAQICDWPKGIRRRLDELGLRHVRVVGMEWAKFGERALREFDILEAAGLIPNVVAGGAGHCYRGCPTPNDYDSRWKRKGAFLYSCETGNASSPGAQARFPAALNHGAALEIFHLGQSASPTDTDASQKLIRYDGSRTPWHQALRIMAKEMIPGTIMRLCTSSDRPAGLPPLSAQRMIRTFDSNKPRINVAAGRRPDGRWVLVAVNATYGSADEFNAYLNAHYKATLEQPTVRFDELLGKSGTWAVRRASMAGQVSGPDPAKMVDGQIRFTLAPGETIVLLGEPV